MSFIDLQPVGGFAINNTTDNHVSIATIIDGINEVISYYIDGTIDYINIIAVDTTIVHMLNDFIRALPIDVKYSISYMKDYKITTVQGDLNYHAPMVVLHDGIKLDTNMMSLRIFSTMSYRFTKPVYITLFENDHSHYSVLNNIHASNYVGYGRGQYTDAFTLKYDLL